MLQKVVIDTKVLQTKLINITSLLQLYLHIKNYQLLGCFKSEGECIGAIGYTPDYRLSVGGKMIYIDDLVVDEKLRGQGIGDSLLKQVIETAKEQGCKAVVLDSGKQRTATHKFYLDRGFDITSYNFKLFLE